MSACQWPGCERPVRSRGLCDRDRKRAAAAGVAEDFGPIPRDCQQCGERIPRTARDDARYCSVRCGRSAYREANLARERATQSEWYAANAERKRSYTSDWKASNRRRATDTENRRRARRAAVVTEPVDFQKVWDRDQGICHLCGDPVDASLRHPHPLSKSLDHVVPLARGGHHAMSNAALAHLICNIRKGDRLLA